MSSTIRRSTISLISYIQDTLSNVRQVEVLIYGIQGMKRKPQYL